MTKKFKLTIEFEAEYRGEKLGKFVFNPTSITDIVVTDVNNLEILPRHDYELQDVIDSLNQEKIRLAQISKYGELDSKLTGIK